MSQPVRTAVGSFGGSLKEAAVAAPGATVIRAVLARAGLDHARVRLTTRLLHSMKRDGIKRGIATLCIDGGQGIPLALEAI